MKETCTATYSGVLPKNGPRFLNSFMTDMTVTDTFKLINKVSRTVANSLYREILKFFPFTFVAAVDVKRMRSVKFYHSVGLEQREMSLTLRYSRKMLWKFLKFSCFPSWFKQVKCCIIWVRWWNKSTMKEPSLSVLEDNIFNLFIYHYILKAV